MCRCVEKSEKGIVVSSAISSCDIMNWNWNWLLMYNNNNPHCSIVVVCLFSKLLHILFCFIPFSIDISLIHSQYILIIIYWMTSEISIRQVDSLILTAPDYKRYGRVPRYFTFNSPNSFVEQIFSNSALTLFLISVILFCINPPKK